MESIRLLLVDDEDVFLKTLANRLKKRGLPAMTANSGTACLTLMASQPVDVVVLDVKMPGLSGLDILPQIKRNHPHTEVIFLTAHESAAGGVAGIKAGAFDYLIKPVELEHLIEKIKQARDKQLRIEEKAREASFRDRINKQQAATERLAALGILASGVAHEINNPLAIILEWAGLIKSLLNDPRADIPGRKDVDMGLEKIEAAVNRAKRITCQLLGLVQKNSEFITEIDIITLISDVVMLVEREANTRKVRIIQRPKHDRIFFFSNPYLLRQIFLNLLNNAIQATGPGGTITIGTILKPDEILFSFKDTGIGISRENMDKIFDPFFTTKAPGEGVGLGLYVTRRIVDSLGGKIAVNSIPDHGSDFKVHLPRILRDHPTTSDM